MKVRVVRFDSYPADDFDALEEDMDCDALPPGHGSDGRSYVGEGQYGASGSDGASNKEWRCTAHA